MENNNNWIIQHEISNNNKYKEIEITAENVSGENRKLKAVWSMEAEQDFKAWNIGEYVSILKENLMREIMEEGLSSDFYQEQTAYEELFFAIENTEIADLLPVQDVIFLLNSKNSGKQKTTDDLIRLIEIGKKVSKLFDEGFGKNVK